MCQKRSPDKTITELKVNPGGDDSENHDYYNVTAGKEPLGGIEELQITKEKKHDADNQRVRVSGNKKLNAYLETVGAEKY